ncbi:hypothetical protein NPX13_g3901 [Xylaria arbuscula]|uniref:Uncharacterized protein n=1 Tax=Xylaria arbuscula TaxID=114810 RepID=A0A9W8TME5_9PEZI|nr:hypothetical protein NPX13_g3901 [Xylaria arbuscula]
MANENSSSLSVLAVASRLRFKVEMMGTAARNMGRRRGEYYLVAVRPSLTGQLGYFEEKYRNRVHGRSTYVGKVCAITRWKPDVAIA